MPPVEHRGLRIQTEEPSEDFEATDLAKDDSDQLDVRGARVANTYLPSVAAAVPVIPIDPEES